MGRISRDSVIALLLLVFCGTFFWASFQIEDMGYSSMGSELWPQAILVVLTIFVLVFFVQSVAKTVEPEDKKERRGVAAWFAQYRNPIWCFVLFFVFLVTMPYLGMLLGGVLFVFLTLTALGERSMRHHVLHGVVAVVSITGMWAIFRFGLHVFLPEGELFYGVF